MTNEDGRRTLERQETHDPSTGSAASPNLDRYRQILAEAESLAEMLADAMPPLLAKHTGGGLQARLAIELACTMHLADALRDNTTAMRDQTEVLKDRSDGDRG